MKHFAVVTALTLALGRGARADEDIAALIKRQSQEFSDASASGDPKVFEKYLDDDVVFTLASVSFPPEASWERIEAIRSEARRRAAMTDRR